MSGFESWIDRQVREAQERGEFDNLPGAGKPIPGLNGRQGKDWWVKRLIERENLRPVLPTTLALAKEAEDLMDTVSDVRSEAAGREIVTNLNERIRDSRRHKVDGPPIWIRTLNADRIVDRWRELRGE